MEHIKTQIRRQVAAQDQLPYSKFGENFLTICDARSEHITSNSN